MWKWKRGIICILSTVQIFDLFPLGAILCVSLTLVVLLIASWIYISVKFGSDYFGKMTSLVVVHLFTKMYVVIYKIFFYIMNSHWCSIPRFSLNWLIYLGFQNGEILIQKFPFSYYVGYSWYTSNRKASKCLIFPQRSKLCHIQIIC